MTTAVSSHSKSKPRWNRWAQYAIMGFLTLVFLMSGGSKLMGAEMHVENLARWGYPSWFMIATGLVEISSLVLLWIPRTRTLGVIGLGAAMVGAVGTHLMFDEASQAMMPAVLLVLSLVVSRLGRD